MHLKVLLNIFEFIFKQIKKDKNNDNYSYLKQQHLNDCFAKYVSP